MKSTKKQTIKDLFYNGLKIINRFLILFIPICFCSMFFLDMVTTGQQNYSDLRMMIVLKSLFILFYGICLWIIFFSFTKIRLILLLGSILIIIATVYFSPDLKKIYQHGKCLEVSDYPCPKGVILKGG